MFPQYLSGPLLWGVGGGGQFPGAEVVRMRLLLLLLLLLFVSHAEAVAEAVDKVEQEAFDQGSSLVWGGGGSPLLAGDCPETDADCL
jgi:hypothetical protein